jgi:hypothetical protein
VVTRPRRQPEYTPTRGGGATFHKGENQYPDTLALMAAHISSFWAEDWRVIQLTFSFFLNFTIFFNIKYLFSRQYNSALFTRLFFD